MEEKDCIQQHLYLKWLDLHLAADGGSMMILRLSDVSCLSGYRGIF